MKTHNIEKREYTVPVVEHIKLDNEISLALESAPPIAPGEFSNNAPQYFNNDPFKTNQA
jgi:hypothetical protein